MSDSNVVRNFDGFSVYGERIDIRLYPSVTGEVRVSVIATAFATGFKDGARMGGEDVPSAFSDDEIVVTDAQLQCLSVRLPSVPEYREGFIVGLEPGMADLIRQVLPRLFKASAVSKAIWEHAQSLFDRNVWPHEVSAIETVVAGRLIDGKSLRDAIDEARHWGGEKIFPKESDLYRVFQSESVLQILSAAEENAN